MILPFDAYGIVDYDGACPDCGALEDEECDFDCDARDYDPWEDDL